ncbi:MAG: retropepsin-like aspartic protease [Capsulimonas sp.]|uniref:retropepsin-like aspartic protease n=1 Tax=Capsulimonas sp. TaxID=2494211 RepID=UPI003265CF96
MNIKLSKSFFKMSFLIVSTSILILPAALVAQYGAHAQTDGAAPKTPRTKSGASEKSSRFHVQGDIQTLPITMVREFPYISAEVNGIPGKLMFDTGGQGALSLNDHLITNLGPGKVVGKGMFGSGQEFTVNLHSSVDHVSVGEGANRLSFTSPQNIISQNLEFMQKDITPGAMGLIGYEFFDGYLMKLDYGGGKITFYKATEARRASKDFLKGEIVLATLPFETRKLPNHPLIPLKIGSHDFLGAFDTGQLGGAYLNPETQQAMMQEGLLKPLSQKSGEGGPARCRIDDIHLTGDDGHSITAFVDAVPVFNQPSPAAEPMGAPEANIINLGYAFLSHYKTVWDYPDKKIYLLKK